jgi:hypothetical protein
LEKQGKFGEAAENYALYALKSLLDGGFRHGRYTRLAFSHILEALSAEVRAENLERGNDVFDLFRPVFEAELESIADRDTKSYRALEGLLNEWFGDAWLMLDSEKSIERYQRALSIYVDHDDPGRNWAFEEEFDYAYWAFESFAESHGKSLPDKYELDFCSRARLKIDLAEEILLEG